MTNTADIFTPDFVFFSVNDINAEIKLTELLTVAPMAEIRTR